MKQTLQLKLSQHLTLTPQLQQSIRLLQLSTLELNQELEKFLTDNPLLEREDADNEAQAAPIRVNGEPATAVQAQAEEPSAESSSAADTISAEIDWVGDAGPGAGGRDDADENDFFQVPAESPNLREHLLKHAAQPLREECSAPVDADDAHRSTRAVARLRVALGDLVRDASERSPQLVLAEDDPLTAVFHRFLPGLTGPG